MSHPKRDAFYIYTQGSTFEFLRHSLQPYQSLGIHTKLITARDILEQDCLASTSDNVMALFFPGSQTAQFYRDDLGADGTAKVQHYVRDGGTFIGICAGGYYGCAEIDYHGMRRRKQTQDNFSFFDGRAYGQLHGLLTPMDGARHGWQTANVTSLGYQLDERHDQTRVLYWGGPAYHPAPGERIDVLATYPDIRFDGAPAIAMAAKDYGAGRAVISGVHPEISSDLLIHSRAAQRIDHDQGAFRHNLITMLTPHEAGRHTVFSLMVGQVFHSQNGLNSAACPAAGGKTPILPLASP